MNKIHKGYVPLDFEYFNSNEKNQTLVCCSLIYEGKLYEYWILDPDERARLKRNLLRMRDEGKYLIAFNVSAEARSLMSLGLNAIKMKWIDVQAEYKMLLNHNHKFEYGTQYMDGVIKTTVPPHSKYRMSEEDKKKADASKPKKNLLACTYKLLGIKGDSDYKDKMRDLILSKDLDLINANRKEIQDYCSSDVHELIALWLKIKAEYRLFSDRENIEEVTIKEVLYRGETVARTALMERTGYPVNVSKLRKLSMNAPIILKDLMEDINSQFDWALFSPNKSSSGYKQNQKIWKEFIAKSEHSKGWLKTDKGGISLSLEAFTSKFSYRHDFPEGNFFAQAIRFLKTKQVLNGLTPSKDSIKKRDTIFDNLGSDGRVRCYLNSYGGQSSRYQPPAKSFIFLKPAWMRGVVEAPKGRAIVGIDYKSEEALIGGLNAGDKSMLEAYASGDVYLDYAKRAGAVPQNATKATHKAERDLFKASYLGISYLMGAESLAKKLTADTGKEYTKAQAQKLIDDFFNVAYPTYKQHLDDVFYTYEQRGYVKLKDGWFMFGDNPNYRSVSNVGIQGMGSCILRRAIALAQDAGLSVLFGLHDALYVEYEAGDYAAIDTLAKCMEQAFIDMYPKNKKGAKLIQLDIDTWSVDYTHRTGVGSTPEGRELNIKDIYVDPRSVKEYEKFKRYMI